MAWFGKKQEEPKKVSGFGEPETYKSKFKIVAWFKNYWYYYKIPVIITACVLIMAVWFIVDQVTRVDDDFRLCIVTDAELISEQYDPLLEAFEPYVDDFNGDRRVSTGVQYLNLAKNPADEVQMTAYEQIVTIFFDRAVSILLVDDYTFEYLRNSDGVAPLADYGVTGGIDEYRIPIAGTSFSELSPILEKLEPMYLVFRVCPEADAAKKDVAANYAAMTQFMQAMADEGAKP